MNTKKFASRRLVVTAMLIAVIIVLMATGVGFLRIGPVVSVTFLCLPVLIGVMTEGLGVGLLLGFVFGSISFIQAFSAPTLLSPFFVNPLISVVPRLIIPVAVYGSVRLMEPLFRAGGAKRVLARGVAAFIGSMTNTVVVLLSIYIACALGKQVGDLDLSAMGALLLTIVLTNGLPEAACMTLVTPPILAALDRSIGRKQPAR